jgi:hypothetical protein
LSVGCQSILSKAVVKHIDDYNQTIKGVRYHWIPWNQAVLVALPSRFLQRTQRQLCDGVFGEDREFQDWQSVFSQCKEKTFTFLAGVRVPSTSNRTSVFFRGRSERSGNWECAMLVCHVAEISTFSSDSVRDRATANI